MNLGPPNGYHMCICFCNLGVSKNGVVISFLAMTLLWNSPYCRIFPLLFSMLDGRSLPPSLLFLLWLFCWYDGDRGRFGCLVGLGAYKSHTSGCDAPHACLGITCFFTELMLTYAQQGAHSFSLWYSPVSGCTGRETLLSLAVGYTLICQCSHLFKSCAACWGLFTVIMVLAHTWLWTRIESSVVVLGFPLAELSKPWAVLDIKLMFSWLQGSICSCGATPCYFSSFAILKYAMYNLVHRFASYM